MVRLRLLLVGDIHLSFENMKKLSDWTDQNIKSLDYVLPYLFEQEKKVSNTVEKYGQRGKTRLINHTKSTYGIYSRSLLTWRIVDSAPNAVCC